MTLTENQRQRRTMSGGFHLSGGFHFIVGGGQAVVSGMELWIRSKLIMEMDSFAKGMVIDFERSVDIPWWWSVVVVVDP